MDLFGLFSFLQAERERENIARGRLNNLKTMESTSEKIEKVIPKSFVDL
jgi:hypothetical protein